IFDVEREFPIVALFDKINRRFALYFTRGVWNWCTLQIDLFLQLKKTYQSTSTGNKLMAHQITNFKFSVTGHGDVATVNLQRRTCTCRIFYLDKIPCPHAMTAIRSQHGADFGNKIY
ncbi:hypothetical protein EJD97_014982, partial [Solanum chilense]